MGAPGSRILLSPGGLSRSGCLCAVFRHGRLPKPGPLDDPGLMPVSGPGIQIGDTGGIRIILAGIPAARPLRRGQRPVSASGMTDPVRHAPAGGSTSAMAIPEDPVGGM